MTQVTLATQAIITKAAAENYLNNPQAWLREPMFEAPESSDKIASIQREIDSIVGVTRDNESIIKIVWNGDRRYWKSYFSSWDSCGQGKELIQRPIVCYRRSTDINGQKFDAFPPRWLLITRIEAEQFADNYAETCYVYDPELNLKIQIKPTTMPKVMWVWFETVAEHTPFCCTEQYRMNEMCYGLYAPPEKVLHTLRQMTEGMDKSGFTGANPFAPLAQIAEKQLNAHTLRTYEADAITGLKKQQD